MQPTVFSVVLHAPMSTLGFMKPWGLSSEPPRFLEDLTDAAQLSMALSFRRQVVKQRGLSYRNECAICTRHKGTLRSLTM
jgi:hypothetical protein